MNPTYQLVNEAYYNINERNAQKNIDIKFLEGEKMGFSELMIKFTW